MAICPLKVDVRAVIDKVQKDNFTAAYLLYRNQVVFPRIVSMICDQPCQSVCVRKPVDIAVDMRYIERACVEFTKDREPIAYNVPRKNNNIAIIGGGISGLACALKLASRNYDVTVYEKLDIPGGRLHGLLPRDIYVSDIQNEFKAVTYRLITSKEILHLDEIHADAVYVATGAGGITFGLQDEMDCDSLGTKKRSVFLGGSVIGADPIEAIEHGIRVSHSIEKYLKVGLMDGVPETFTKRPVEPNYYKLRVTGRGLQDNLQGNVTREHAIVEAGACLKCDCSLCGDGCDLMKKFRRNPKRIVQDVMTTLRPIEQFSKRVASRLINSCNQCGVCATVCPENVDLEDCLLQARRFLHRDGALPAAYHDFWLRDMEFANSDQASLVLSPEVCVESRYMFFPGCQLGASDPNCVIEAYRFLKKVDGGASLLVGCCGVPADWAGQEVLRDNVHGGILQKWESMGEPTMVLACPTCLKTFSRYLPRIKTTSLYNIMAQSPGNQWQEHGTGKIVSVFDPCASRYDPTMQENVRKLIIGAGFQIEELACQGPMARCCSYGGHIQAANLEQVKNITANRIQENANPYVTYCSNCRDTFASAGKQCSHILDIIFNTGVPDRSAPDLSQRRRNRVTLVNELTGKKISKKENSTPMDSIYLDISTELKKQMNDYLILEEDVIAVIMHCEATGNGLLNKRSGDISAHLCHGAVTYWVTYEKSAFGYKVKNVYSHRMKIQDDKR